MFDWIRERFLRAAEHRADAETPDPRGVEAIDGMWAASEPCALFGHYDLASHPRRAIADLKINGLRAVCPPRRIVTRNALPLNAALHCRPILDALEEVYGQPMVFDGEYVEHEGIEATLAAHKRGVGAGVLWLFDAVPFDEWKRDRFTQKLSLRRGLLDNAMRQVSSPFVGLLKHDTVTAEEVMPLAEYAWKQGHEGIVVKDADSVYFRGRSKAWSKVKRRETREAKILDLIVEGDAVKSMMVKMIDTGRTLRVGANIPPDLRREMAFCPEVWSGKCVEIAFTDTNDGGTLTGAYFITLRPDRD